MSSRSKSTAAITRLILKAAEDARKETGDEPDSFVVSRVEWPVPCTVGPGLEGAIACESKVGFVNGSRGRLSYRGYDIFDLSANSTYEEVAYLLLHGHLPTTGQLERFSRKLNDYLAIPQTIRTLASFPIEEMHTMAAVRLGTNLLRREWTTLDLESGRPDTSRAIGSDEDSIAMETLPRGEERAIYEFKGDKRDDEVLDSCSRLISGLAALTAAVARLGKGRLPISPRPDLSHAGNFLYMMTGETPTAEQERIMDIALILHADHGMNASTFASLVVASTLSDIYSSVSAGIGALTGPLHGGANEQVVLMLREIGTPANVKDWCEKTLSRRGGRIMGVGHRVYKAYDPRARVLAPVAKYLARKNAAVKPLYGVAVRLEKEAVSRLGTKGIFPNVDFFSGMVYSGIGIPDNMFTPIFAVSRVAGWTARIHEYLQNNRIFRPRAMYSGPVGREYEPIAQRDKAASEQAASASSSSDK